MMMRRDELANCLIYQIGALNGFLEAEGMPLNHVKPHGSLYAMAARQEDVAHAVCDAAEVFGAPVLGMLGTLHETIYPKRGLPFVAEFYSDLDYADDGSLIITRVHDAKDPQQAADRCRRAIAEGRVQSVGGREVRVGAETICVHSDTPNALEIAAAVRAIVARDPQPSN